jgi:hypothetical protein
MIGFELQYPTTMEKVKITNYISASEVTLESAMPVAWIGQTVYILGNYILLRGQLADFREVTGLEIKYYSTDTYTFKAEKIRRSVQNSTDTRWYNRAEPYYYETTIREAGIQTRAIGLLPYPVNYNGQFTLYYTQLPAELVNDTDVFQLDVVGITEAIIAEVTAWGAKILGLDKLFAQSSIEAKELISQILTSYKPRSRGGPTYITLDRDYYEY